MITRQGLSMCAKQGLAPYFGGFESLTGHMSTEDPTLEEIEAETVRLEARTAELKRLKRIKNAKATPTGLLSEFEAEAVGLQVAESTSDPAELAKILLTKAMRKLEYMETHNGPDEPYTGPNYYANVCTQQGRVQGIAGVLSAITGTTLSREMRQTLAEM